MLTVEIGAISLLISPEKVPKVAVLKLLFVKQVTPRFFSSKGAITFSFLFLVAITSFLFLNNEVLV
ncbi:hypothetical protein BTO04_00310 [Polaribacter sp. SA4-10]|nr:hypothetical protein BTO04_00310 [Polaribacter sp. SA4-10]